MGAARMLAACRSEPVDRTPVWFMRQAGRCLAGYRELRERHDILEITRTPELCAQVTVMPVDELGVDPIVHEPVRDRAAVRALRIVEPEGATPDLFEAIRLVRRELSGRTAL